MAGIAVVSRAVEAVVVLLARDARRDIVEPAQGPGADVRGARVVAVRAGYRSRRVPIEACRAVAVVRAGARGARGKGRDVVHTARDDGRALVGMPRMVACVGPHAVALLAPIHIVRVSVMLIVRAAPVVRVRKRISGRAVVMEAPAVKRGAAPYGRSHPVARDVRALLGSIGVVVVRVGVAVIGALYGYVLQAVQMVTDPDYRITRGIGSPNMALDAVRGRGHVRVMAVGVVHALASTHVVRFASRGNR